MPADTTAYIRDICTLVALLFTAFGTWWTVRQATENKIEELRKTFGGDLSKIKDDFKTMTAAAVPRSEHDNDILQVRQEIRSFRDEVRDDIRSLNTTLTTRFDMMMQRILDAKTSH